MTAPIAIVGSVSGDKVAIEYLERRGDRILERLRDALTQSGDELKGAIYGGAMVHNRRGRLAGSVYRTVRKYARGTYNLTVGVGKRGFYGRFIEDGVDRTGIRVKAHVRRTGAYKGRVIHLDKNGVAKGFRRKTIGSSITYVKAITNRSMRMPARPFVQPAYTRLKVRIEARITAAVQQEG